MSHYDALFFWSLALIWAIWVVRRVGRVCTKHEPGEIAPAIPERSLPNLLLHGKPALCHIMEASTGKGYVCRKCGLLYWVWEVKP